MQIDPAILSILKDHHLTLTPDDISKLIDLLRARDKVGAITLIRRENRAGLKEAKDAADAIEQIIQKG